MTKFNSSTSIGTSISIGTSVAWTPNTFFDSWTSQSGVTTTDLVGSTYNTNNLVWQLFYAHTALKISATTARAGINPHMNGSNAVSIRAAVSTIANTMGSFGGEAAYGSTSGAYTAGVLISSPFSTQLTIPANRYFLLGTTSGPFYRTYKTLATNRTATYNGSNVVTSFNKFWWPGWPTGPTTGIPTQLGGAASFTEISGYVPVTSFKFELN